MPQTTYQRDYDPAIAGMIADTGLHAEITSKTASEPIPAGSFVVLDAAGTVSLPKTAGGIPANGNGALYGLALYKNLHSIVTSGIYATGEMVPILRQGRAWALYVGTAAAGDMAALRVEGASDNSATRVQYRGWATDGAAGTTVGQEKTALARGVARGGSALTANVGLAIVELNIP